MTHIPNECACETCQERAKLEKLYPNMEVGVQYAMWDWEEFQLLVSAEELPYIQGDVQDRPFERLEPREEQYFIAYGVFRSQTNFNQNFSDLSSSTTGTYFYFVESKQQTFEVKIIDFLVLSKQNDEAKVCVLLKSNHILPFPKSQEELSVTLSFTMLDLGETLEDLVFSRIEYGVFRLDQGKKIDKDKIGRWKTQISSKKSFEIPFKRFLLVEIEK